MRWAYAVSDAARILGIELRRAYWWCDEGLLLCFRLGDKMLVDAASLEEARAERDIDNEGEPLPVGEPEEARAAYTLEEIARMWGIHPRTLDRKREAGTLPAFRVGRSWYVRKEIIEAIMAGDPDAPDLSIPVTINTVTKGDRLAAARAARAARTRVSRPRGGALATAD